MAAPSSAPASAAGRAVALVVVVLAVALSAVPRADAAPGFPQRKVVEAWTTHGINNFRGVKIMDLSNDSLIWGSLPPISEVGVMDYDPDATNATEINENTLKADWLANIHVSDLTTYFGVEKGTGPFNQPLDLVQTLRPFSKGIGDRSVPSLFSETLTDPTELSLYKNSGSYERITLGIWNYGRAKARVFCRSEYDAVVKITIHHGISCGLYTVWDVGVLWPLAANETFSAGPFGGVPNVITTDSKGRGSITRQVNYCPMTSCKSLARRAKVKEDKLAKEAAERMAKQAEERRLKTAGRIFDWWPAGLPVGDRPQKQDLPDDIENRPPRCLVYLSLFYHFDNMIYGGSPALDNGGYPIGQVGGNQMQIFFQGKRSKEHVKMYRKEIPPAWEWNKDGSWDPR